MDTLLKSKKYPKT